MKVVDDTKTKEGKKIIQISDICTTITKDLQGTEQGGIGAITTIIE